MPLVQHQIYRWYPSLAKGVTQSEMVEDRMAEQNGRNRVTVGTQNHNRLLASDEHSEQLLPGIPDEITLDHITSKLPWRAFHILASVSRAWKQAIQSRQVHEARIRSHSTEAFVVLNHTLYPEQCGVTYSLSLYSTTDQSCYQLPPLPEAWLESPRPVPRSCQCIALDGKIYLIGGEDEFLNSLMGGEDLNGEENDFDWYPSSDVYVFDLAGQTGWKQCANMRESRAEFCCGVVHGKIYVFGGTDFSDDPSRDGCEVYDPRANAWSSIMPRNFYHNDVVTVGEELFVPGRGCPGHDEDTATNLIRGAPFLEAYHPGENRWRVFQPPEHPPSLEKSFFLAQGKMHLMTWHGIFVLDMDAEKKSWTQLHSFLFAEIAHTLIGSTSILSVIGSVVTMAINGELLALVDYYNTDTEICNKCLLQSKGFGSEKKELMWEKANCSLSFENMDTAFICPVQL